MRKLLSVLSSTLQGGVRRGLLFFALLATTTLWAHDFSVNGIYYNYLDGNNVAVTYRGEDQYSYSNEYSGEVIIPETVTYNGTTNSVTSIGDYAFCDCSSLTSIAIPNSVTSIGDKAFRDCSSLTSVTIPNSVTTIGDWAFSDCSSLTSMVVESGNTEYDSRNNCNAIIETATNTLIAGCQTTIIPNSVTSIGDEAFRFCSSLTSITIPNSVTSIGGSAFYGCTSLTSVTIGNSVTSIGEDAFSHCYSLTSITIPNSVTSIGDYTFYGCTSLTSITIPNSVTSIGNHAFYECTSLTSINIPNSVTSIGNSAFSSCDALTFITIPNSVTSIGDEAFRSCSSLTSITIPNSVTSIGWAAFYGCTSLTSITIPNSVTSIGERAFSDCSSLTSITIPNSVTSIGERAFSDCSSLTSITCEATIPPTIESFTFDGVYKSIRVYVPCGSESAYKAADGWKEFTNIQEPLAEYSIQVYTSNSQMGSAKVNYNNCIGTQITATANYGYHFAQWSDGNTDNPRTLTLTKDITLTAEFEEIPYYTVTLNGNSLYGSVSIWDWDFYDESQVQFEVLSGTEIQFREDDGCGTWLGWSDGVTDNERTITITSDTTISSRFDVETYSVSITAGEGGYLEYGNIEREYNECNSEWIYNCAYANDGYYFVGWSDGNTNNCIDIYPYEDINLVAQFAPKKQFTVLVGVDNACKNMGSVSGSGIYYPDDYVTISATPNAGYHFVEWSDGNSNATRELYLQSDITLFATFAPGEYGGKCGDNLQWAYDTDTKALTITGSGDMWNYYFYESNTPWEQVASDITSVFLPDGLTRIGVEAFEGCKSLTSITIPESVTSIGSGAFGGCSSLTSINIPSSVTSIGDGAFAACSKLTSITIPNSVTSIGGGAEYGGPFEYCSSLTSVTIPNSVTYIGYQAFLGCSALTSITIPNSVTYIGYRVFYGCSSLNSITCEATTPPMIESYTFDGVSKSIRVYVPCGSESAYKAAGGWKELTNIQEPQAEYSIQVYTSNSQMGSAKVNYNNCTGNQITATANHGYHFVQWSDGVTDNPRVLEVTQDTVLTAEFAQTFSGRCGDKLYWAYNESDQSIAITGTGDMYDYTATTQPWLLFKEQIKEVTTSSTATSIGESAFAGAIRLGDVYLGSNMETIAKEAFSECNRLHHIYCHPTYPPFADQSSFANYNVYLHVPCDYQEEYDLDMVWGNFKYIECMGAESEPSAPDTVIVIPGTNDVTITWPTEDNADTYTIVIKKGDEVFCTLTFNADGQLLNIAFAPSREGNNRPVQYAEQMVNGYRFTVTGLTDATKYAYDITTKDAANKTIATYSGEFTTKSNVATNMENIQSPVTTCQKLLRNGQLLILRDGKTYNIMGAPIQ